MSKTRELHEKAMEFCDEAFFAKRNGDLASAKEFSQKALFLEIQAAETLKDDLDKEPSRSILYKSAAILAIECEEFEKAGKLISVALSGNPPFKIKQDLNELLKKTNSKNTVNQGFEVINNSLVKDKPNYIFVFGKAYIGKTTIIASLLNYIGGNWEYKLSQPMDILSSRIVETLQHKNFPDRTCKGTVNKLNVEFLTKQGTENSINLTFLDMAGEELRQIPYNQSILPNEIEEFLKNGNLSKIFVLVTSPDQAMIDDSLMASFLDYIASKDKTFSHSKVILLISKWDTFIGNMKSSVFLKSRMPMTYSKLEKNKNAFFGRFSVGSIFEIEDEIPKIKEYDRKYPKELLSWLYKTLSGNSVNASREIITEN